MRRFYIETGGGERRGLNGETGVWLTDPGGLGATLAASYADLKNGFFRPTGSDAEPQASITGTLTFTGADPYNDYLSFFNWLSGAAELFLIYVPFGETEYRRKIEINYLTKTELRSTWLALPVSFAALTPWYRATPVAIEISDAASNSMRYDIIYTSELIYGTDSSTTFSAEIAPAGQAPAAINMQYVGSIDNPTITLRGANTGAILGRCAISASLNSGDTLELSTAQENSYVRRITSGGVVTDLLDAVDLSYDPFPRAAITEPTVLELTASGPFSGTALLLIYYYFRSV